MHGGRGGVQTPRPQFAPNPRVGKERCTPKSTAQTCAGQPPLDLPLERLPNGELAWLRPARMETGRRTTLRGDRRRRRTLTMDAAFDRSPTVAQLYGQFHDTCGS